MNHQEISGRHLPASSPQNDPAPAAPPCDRAVLVLDSGGRRGTTAGGNRALVVPIDHDQVLPADPRPFRFSGLASLFESRRGEIMQFLAALEPAMRDISVSEERQDDREPFWNNGYFSGADARCAYAIVRTFLPREVLEIGSGNSTKFFRKAIADGRLKTKLTSIDPAPRAEIDAISDLVIRRPLQELPLELFRKLAPGDVLFFDGSHLCFSGSDVADFFFRILPAIAAGVWVHLHDITLPDEYLSDFDGRYYNEQHILAAFLTDNAVWKPMLPVWWSKSEGLMDHGGVSFWMRKDAAT